MAGMSPIFFMLLMFGVFYFILIRPQVKKQREHTTMLNALKQGDVVVTRGGLIGKITGVSEITVTLELQEKVRVRILRAYIDAKHDPAKLERADSSAKAA